eukprot:4017581-Pyramimonas_sp.AAC.1
MHYPSAVHMLDESKTASLCKWNTPSRTGALPTSTPKRPPRADHAVSTSRMMCCTISPVLTHTSSSLCH